VPPTNKTFFLPHWGGPGNGHGHVTWEDWELPGFEDAVEALGGEQGAGLTAVVLAYLTQIWVHQRRPLQGVENLIPIDGSGFYTVADGAFNPNAIGGGIIIDSFPDDIDMIFGELPIYYFGMAGFGSINAEGITGELFGRAFQIGSNQTGTPFFFPPQFLNHKTNILNMPPNPNLPNLVWWHLKPGVTGRVSLLTEDTMFGVTANTSDASDSYGQSYNPTLNYPWAGGPLDGGLNPTQPP
jgi:hypothetical protein